MAYDLHIMRRSDWSDATTPGIAESEWLRAISGDTDADAFYWHDGYISVKNSGRRKGAGGRESFLNLSTILNRSTAQGTSNHR